MLEFFDCGRVVLCLTALSVAAPKDVDTEKKSFYAHTKSKFFIDKTLFIKEFMGLRDKNNAIFAPKGFGKSVNLMMMKSFLEIQVDLKGGAVQEPYNSGAYRLFKNLKIAKEQTFFDSHFAKYPVIDLDFKDFDVSGSKKEFDQSLREIVYVLLTRFNYLLKSPKLDDFDKQVIRREYDALTRKGHVPDVKFMRDLTVFLRTHFDQKCVVLIDNFDTPIMTAILESETFADDQRSSLSDLTRFVEALLKENNNNVIRSLSTGVNRAGYDFNFLNFISAFDHPKLGPFYGFNFDEVRGLLVKTFTKIPLTKVENLTTDIGRWYGGFNVKDSKISLFYPISVIKFLKEKKLKYYWETPSIITHLRGLFTFERVNSLMELTLVTGIKAETRDRLPNYELLDLRNYLRGDPEVAPFEIIDVAFQIFLENGYYRPLRYFKYQEVEGFTPNYEIKTDLRDMVYTVDYLKAKHKVTDKDITSLIDSVHQLGSTQETFQNFVKAVLHTFRINMPDHEYKFVASIYTFLRHFKSSSFAYVLFEENLTDNIKLMVGTSSDSLIVFKYRFNREAARVTLSQLIEETQNDIQQQFLLTKHKTFILFGMHLNTWRECRICYVYNSLNMTEAVDVAAA